MRSLRQEYRRFREALALGYSELREQEDEERRRAELYAKYGVDNERDLWATIVAEGKWGVALKSSGSAAWRAAVEQKAPDYP